LFKAELFFSLFLDSIKTVHYCITSYFLSLPTFELIFAVVLLVAILEFGVVLLEVGVALFVRGVVLRKLGVVARTFGVVLRVLGVVRAFGVVVVDFVGGGVFDGTPFVEGVVEGVAFCDL